MKDAIQVLAEFTSIRATKLYEQLCIRERRILELRRHGIQDSSRMLYRKHLASLYAEIQKLKEGFEPKKVKASRSIAFAL